MFRSKKSIKNKTNNSTKSEESLNEAIALNEETEPSTHMIDDTVNTSYERIYMNMPMRQHSEDDAFPSVRVKHSISYEYDDKKFEIFKDEYLFLINRTNQDWWLCLRLDENLTFFVPASYLDEIEQARTSRLVPPPRPPPPPPKPTSTDSFTSNINNFTELKPEVKQRNFVNLITDNRKTLFEYSAAEAIINDLEEHLDREEASFSQLNDKQIYENVSKLDTTNTNDDEDEEDDNDDDVVDDDDEDDAFDEDDEELAKRNLFEQLKIPPGWKMCMSGCKRNVFYNEITHEIWYLNYDSAGKPYYYNKEGESIWQLKETSKKDDKETESSQVYASNAAAASLAAGVSNAAHFQKNFDEDLETFKTLYSRLSIRRPNNEATSTSLSLSNHDTSSDMTKSTKSSNSVYNNSNSNKSQTLPYENFKCIRLIENGKKHKKKTVEDLRVYLTNSKLLFVKIVKGGIEKLELSMDIKNARCVGLDQYRPMTSTPVNTNTKDKNNNTSKSKSSISSSSASSSHSSVTVKRDKELNELLELVGVVRSAFLIETFGKENFKILFIHENVNIINEWIQSINSVINQIVNIN